MKRSIEFSNRSQVWKVINTMSIEFSKRTICWDIPQWTKQTDEIYETFQ